MQEVKRKAAASIMDGQETRKVNIYVDSLLTLLTGQWQWDMISDAVFCSDVIISIPYTFYGTKGIIHPDDVTAVREALFHLQENEQVALSFR
ncbi:MAG TPA: hypothetical protein VEY32_08080, partial [Flavisolibacter sp.]|nr:hypothetical protein [Flavisolibacter sp.]